MKNVCRLAAASLLMLYASSLSSAQEADFSLGQARVGEAYQQSIQKVLAERYGMRLESGSQAPAFEWALAENLPPGLMLNADGTITGVPRAHQEQPHRFKVKVTDRAMRDAEPLELSLSIQIQPPRIRLVRNNAPRLVPVDRAAGQAGGPTASELAASVSAVGNGNGSSASAPANVVAQPEAPAFSPFAATGEGDSADAIANAAAPPQTQNPPVNRPAVNINEYISVIEQPGGDENRILNASQKLISETEQHLPKLDAANGPALEHLRRLKFRLRADPESTIAVFMSKVPAQNSELHGLKFHVSAELVKEKGTVPLSVVGGAVNSQLSQSGASLAPGALQAVLKLEGASATINLKQANAEEGNTLRVILDAYAGTNSNELVGTHSFDIELTNYGWQSSVSPSMFLLNRQRVRNSDIQPQPGQLTNAIDPVNYSPFPGVNYTFTYKGNKRKKDNFWNFLKPGFGVNATFLNFDDDTINLQNNFQNIPDQILRDKSDVQVGMGAVVTLFGNKLQMTYGGNLSVDRKRAYFGVGVDFLKLLGILQ